MSIHILAGITVQEDAWMWIWVYAIVTLLFIIFAITINEYIKMRKKESKIPIISNEEGKIK